MKKGLYIYCITHASELENLGLTGIDGTKVKTIAFKDINAVVNEIPIYNFNRFDREELNSYITAHQKVNEEVMSAKGGSASGGKYCDVVPMAFGMMAPDTPSVLHILERAYFQFKTALQRIAGKAEFVLQVWWNQKKLLQELVRTAPEIQKLKEELSTKGKILGLPLKLKLGKLIQQKAEAQRQVYLKDIQAFLKSCCQDFTENKLIEDGLIANFSFLIEKTRELELDKKIQELGKKYEGKLRFKYIGPMPPYSFVNINLGLGNFKLVDEAKKILGLGEEATLEEIKKAYYELAHRYHPDKFQGKEEQMKKITRACSVLENYCQSCAELSGKKVDPDEKYSFKKEDVENSLIIK